MNTKLTIMKNILILSFLLFSISAFSQKIEKSSISSGGESTSNGSTSIIYSIGEINVAESTSGNIHISEGFISKKLDSTLGIKDITKIKGAKLYPNPTIDYVNIDFTEIINAQIRIFNSSGKEVLSQIINDNKTRIDLSFLNRGLYLLHVYDIDNARVITYKISKK